MNMMALTAEEVERFRREMRELRQRTAHAEHSAKQQREKAGQLEQDTHRQTDKIHGLTEENKNLQEDVEKLKAQLAVLGAHNEKLTGMIVLADRGVGVLATLRRIRPKLETDGEALQVAFTEFITGRAPEHRGNGLKYVKDALAKSGASLTFQSGDAILELR